MRAKRADDIATPEEETDSHKLLKKGKQVRGDSFGLEDAQSTWLGGTVNVGFVEGCFQSEKKKKKKKKKIL